MEHESFQKCSGGWGCAGDTARAVRRRPAVSLLYSFLRRRGTLAVCVRVAVVCSLARPGDRLGYCPVLCVVVSLQGVGWYEHVESGAQ